MRIYEAFYILLYSVFTLGLNGLRISRLAFLSYIFGPCLRPTNIKLFAFNYFYSDLCWNSVMMKTEVVSCKLSSFALLWLCTGKGGMWHFQQFVACSLINSELDYLRCQPEEGPNSDFLAKKHHIPGRCRIWRASCFHVCKLIALATTPLTCDSLNA